MPADQLDTLAQPPSSPDLAIDLYQARARETELHEEERRRAGRGGDGGGINPANANLGLNIRPDVVEGPAGLEVRTTMKSVDYRANAGLEADLAEAARGAHPERPEPLPEHSKSHDAASDGDAPLRLAGDLEADLSAAARDHNPQREQTDRRTNEESAKRQDAERAARSGEAVPGEVASSTDSLAADLRAAEKAAKLEREGEGQEPTFREHAVTDQAVGSSGGRGL